jgi:hypothetical protein
MNDNEIRWRQIFVNYDKAFLELRKHKDTKFESSLEKAGYIHYFEIALELASKVMFAFLKAKEDSVSDFRQAVKKIKIYDLITNQSAWLKAENRKKLPLFLHKNEKLFDELLDDINDTYLPELEFFWDRLKKED